MAKVDFTSLYQWVGYPTYNWILQSPPYVSPMAGIAYAFSGPLTGGPITFRVLPATTTGNITMTLNIGTSFSDMYNTFKDFTVSLTAGTWAEFELSSAQQAIVNSNSVFYIYLSHYSDPSFYTTGANAAHLIIPDPTSIDINIPSVGWKSGEPWVNVPGVGWKKGKAWVNIGNGVWKQGK